MKILMRNTVFKTAALTGLFLCLLALAGAFSGITASVHATHDEGFIHAEDVDTEADLKQFVEDAVDAYQIGFIIKEHCDFTKVTKLIPFQSQLPDFSTTDIETIKGLVPLFSTLGLTRADIEEGCDFTHRFEEVFGRGEGDWKSDSIYLFVMDDTGKMLYHGADSSVEGNVVVATDEGGRNVIQSIIDEAGDSGNYGDSAPSDAGIVQYCWDDPDVEGDEIDSPGAAPGDSLKISYVVDPFAYLGAPSLADSPGIIFGSGIYPGMDDQFPECDGDGMPSDGDDMDDMDDMTDDMTDDMMDDTDDTMPERIADAVSGGGCAIAAGSDNAPRGNAFNLLLIVSALFFAVSFGNRAMDKQKGDRS